MTDVAGFTELMRTNEPQTLKLLQADIKILRKSISANHGEIVKIAGDGVLALFDDPALAVKACIEAQDALRSSSLKHRMAVHTGRVTLADGDVYGDTVNVCSRLESITTPGTVTASRSLVDLFEPDEVPKPTCHGKVQLKGIKGPVQVSCWGDDARIPKRKRPWLWVGSIGAIFAVAASFAGWSFSRRSDMNKLASVIAYRYQSKASKRNETKDFDTLLDEAMEDLWLERDEYDNVKEQAVVKIDPDLVLAWLQAAQLTPREREEEIKRWENIKSVIQEGRKIVGSTATVDQIWESTFKDKKVDEESRRAFAEEFHKPK